MQCIDEQLTASLSLFLITHVCWEVTGFVEVSLPGGKPEPFNSVTCRPPYPTLVCTPSLSLYPRLYSWGQGSGAGRWLDVVVVREYWAAKCCKNTNCLWYCCPQAFNLPLLCVCVCVCVRRCVWGRETERERERETMCRSRKDTEQIFLLN